MQEKELYRLVYVYDPLCGWCYGFHENLKRFLAEFGEHFAFQSFVGGLVVGDRIGTIEKSYPLMAESVKNVEKRTGVKFGNGFKENALDNPMAYKLDSLPLSQAHVLLRAHNPNIQSELIEALHEYVYEYGHSVYDLEQLTLLAERFGMEKDLFLRNFALNAIKEATEKEFVTVTNWGVKGFPFLFALKGTEAVVFAHGYTDYEHLQGAAQNFLSVE